MTAVSACGRCGGTGLIGHRAEGSFALVSNCPACDGSGTSRMPVTFVDDPTRPEDVECPVCGAAVGEVCDLAAGPRQALHIARWDAAAQVVRARP